ncbi:MAG: flagellin [Clostridia bacterium]|nr:flagellin [Clostridia bacterium]
MIVNHNISALNTYRNLTSVNNALQKSLERLSSGLRINRAGDDAAGLAISEKMRGQILGLNQAVRNAQDGISLIQTAEGGLNEIHAILQRMRELAVQAANDTLTSDDRAKIQDEMNQLRQEIDRIASTTEFNTKKLLNGDIAKLVTDSGTNADSFVDTGYRTTGSTEAGVYTLTFTKAATQAKVGGTESGAVYATTTVANTTDTVNSAAVGTLIINNKTITIESTDTLGDVITKINNLSAYTGVTAQAVDVTDTASSAKKAIQLTTQSYGSSATVQVSGENANQLKALGIITDAQSETVVSDAGTDAVATLIKGSTTYSVISAAGNKVTFSNGLTVQGLDGTVADGHTATVTVSDDQTLNFQIGANEGQRLNLSINKMDAESLGVAGSSPTEALSVSTYASATAAISLIDAAITDVSNERAKLGAYQNRLEHTIANLSVASENITAAESRIRDVDMAKEMMAFTKNQIISQAATAMLAQANQVPSIVLQLLR